ncbi:LysE family translocator [Poseidonibacter ostreae]|uniref:LysE family translocator n=1 Tax=Poseidonibacter ostreae TaxID=2654171 RepID=A0A6L4WR69_9BACT|nr:LysE family translocator [Poseidonibacter ostreae]KAB7884648.1 LysE family translocator [Poseidonibacter ostreae]KAB7885958.1 LysE family translocator [Poseidonibacter ostreae]KAB7888611.1 LysE family translocator [Poseidonibacter ostreae]
MVIILTPGQDMMIVMSRLIAQGKKAGIITAFGVAIGLMGHTILATLGLGTLLLASEWLFNTIKYIGAAYLIYLGYQLLTSNEHKLAMKDMPKVSYKKMLMQGAITNISNPKITIFYFSYLPQFIVPSAGSESLQLFILGTTFAVITFFLKAPIGFLAGLLSSWIKARPMVLNYIHKTSGVILVSLGLKLALSER